MRGYRIELGEIETVLGQHPAVRECVVIAREDEPGDQRLVAYAVALAESEAELAAGELRRYLKQRLPEYMVPGQIMMLESLPLTSNGKVNREGLPAGEAGLTSEEQYVEARTPIGRAGSGSV